MFKKCSKFYWCTLGGFHFICTPSAKSASDKLIWNIEQRTVLPLWASSWNIYKESPAADKCTRMIFHVWSFPGGPHEPIATPQVILKLYKVYPYTLYNGIGVDLIYSQNYMGAPMAYTPHRILVDWSFECQGGCYSWHGAPFDVPSDGHKNVTDNGKKNLN